MANYFRKKLHLRGGLYGGQFQPGLLKRVENNHVIDSYSQSGLKIIDCARGFKLEKQIDECISRIILNYNHFQYILRLFDVLLNFRFTTSETMGDY